jgi:Luciferase-like monooxygenase
VVDIGLIGCLPLEHGAHDSEQRAGDGQQGDLLVRHLHAVCLDSRAEVAPGIWLKGGEHGVVGDVEADEQPAPVRVANGAANEAAVSGEMISAGSSSCEVRASISAPWASTVSTRTASAIAQMSARPPAGTAMAAMTLNHLSGGPFILGLGASGPQVVEGWYGMPFEKPARHANRVIGSGAPVPSGSPAGSRDR